MNAQWYNYENYWSEVHAKVDEIDDFTHSNFLEFNYRKWTPDPLKNHLKNPQENFEDNFMPKIELSHAEVDSFIRYPQNVAFLNVKVDNTD